MTTAGVRLAGGEMVWVETEGLVLHPLDDVVIRIDGAEHRGQVVVTPDQLLRPVPASGDVIHVQPRGDIQAQCSDLPGSDVPPLGSASGARKR